MNELYISSYLSGVMNLASSMSTWIGPSYIEVECYEKENALSNLVKDYHLPKEEYKMEEINENLKDLLKDLLGDNPKLLESVYYWITLHIGEAVKIKTPKERKIIDKLGNSEGGNSPFYIVDDLYLIEFQEYVVFFIIGNNE